MKELRKKDYLVISLFFLLILVVPPTASRVGIMSAMTTVGCSAT